ncbi:hypothetical protein K9L16_02645 [Candidatus Pacearchaeota archaeon]|nr:hypothetical protein [Candidatus Pacearchaeota archaeon]
MNKIDGIINYFEKYINLLESEHSKRVSDKNHTTNKNINSLIFLLTFVMILLTLVSFAIGSINSAPTHLQSIDSLCSSENIKYVNDANFTENCFNLTTQRVALGTTAIETNLEIFNILKWAFLVLVFFLLGFSIFGFYTEKKRNDSLSKLNNKIILINSIILKLHSLKINFSSKLRIEEVANTLNLFDKQGGHKDYDACLEEFDSKLLHLLNKFIRERK